MFARSCKHPISGCYAAVLCVTSDVVIWSAVAKRQVIVAGNSIFCSEIFIKSYDIRGRAHINSAVLDEPRLGFARHTISLAYYLQCVCKVDCHTLEIFTVGDEHSPPTL